MRRWIKVVSCMWAIIGLGSSMALAFDATDDVDESYKLSATCTITRKVDTSTSTAFVGLEWKSATENSSFFVSSDGWAKNKMQDNRITMAYIRHCFNMGDNKGKLPDVNLYHSRSMKKGFKSDNRLGISFTPVVDFNGGNGRVYKGNVSYVFFTDAWNLAVPECPTCE